MLIFLYVLISRRLGPIEVEQMLYEADRNEPKALLTKRYFHEMMKKDF